MASAREPARDGGTKAEINRPELPSLVVNEAFLHDLISTSSHALDETEVNPTQSAHPEPALELFIAILPDKAAKTLTIVDNGVGMTKSDLFRHFGAAASSGFMKAPPPPNAEAGVRGLGLLSAYLVADKVVITTKHDDDEQYEYVWDPQAAGGPGAVKFGLDAAGERLGRGTKVTLFLKENHLEYLANRRLEELLDKYSGCITYPIYLCDGDASAEDEHEVEETIDDDDDGDAITETEDDEEEEAIHDGDSSTETEDDDEEEATHELMKISKQELLRLRAPGDKSMAKGLDDELKAIIRNKQPKTKGKWYDSSSSARSRDEDSEEDSNSSGGGEDSEEVLPAASAPTPPPAAAARSRRRTARGAVSPAASAPTAHSATSSNSFTFAPMFKQVTVGRCYNCLGTDHFVASCRSPRRCLLCFLPGHTARNCALHYQYHGPGAPHRRPAWVAACAPFSDAIKAPERTDPAGVPAPLLYKARVCIEGVPAHARQLETVAGLFAGFALVESLDGSGARAGKEAACVCAWVWTLNPDAIARAGTLLIPEPRGPTWPSLLHSDLRLTSCSPSAAGPPRMLPYEVIIHLDRVYDYSPAPGTGSSAAGGGGLLWPRCHVFSWHLAVLDGAALPPPPRG